ncbi:MAG: glycoside hydrolase family 32 protein [Ginsengibacter sp.]
MKRWRLFFLLMVAGPAQLSNAQTLYHEIYRPQIHFSPKEKWMNDPNGMVYYQGIYHLFFQYYPDSTVWGPMHWGHATSKDLIHWQQQTIALYPDSLGYIFSGSAVVDENNTSGFGKNGQVPLVAIFTQHDPVGEKQHNNIFQNQSIAYSLDAGQTWIKYAGNPVLKNPGITDFRDPKLMWYAPQNKWIMTLATKDRVTFYSSHDLKSWTKESEFGKDIGAHGGVWECPDLISFDDNGKSVWALIVSINPGGPNGGSATQYFIGDFDGKNFTPFSTKTKWIDYGPDNYAGVTWYNTGKRKIFLGWMTNWTYAQKVPTKTWRSAMTVPRELILKHVGNDVFLAAQPVEELGKITTGKKTFQNISVDDLSKKINYISLPCRIDVSLISEDFSMIIANDAGEEIMVGYDKKQNRYFIDRTKSGKIDFQKDFAGKHTAPKIAQAEDIKISIIADMSSIELFADDGLTVMTETYFPSNPYDKISVQSPGNLSLTKFTYSMLNTIW